MDAKNDKNKIREPFPPDFTPTPPQIMNPSLPPDWNERKKPADDHPHKRENAKKENKPANNNK